MKESRGKKEEKEKERTEQNRTQGRSWGCAVQYNDGTNKGIRKENRCQTMFYYEINPFRFLFSFNFIVFVF